MQQKCDWYVSFRLQLKLHILLNPSLLAAAHQKMHGTHLVLPYSIAGIFEGLYFRQSRNFGCFVE